MMQNTLSTLLGGIDIPIQLYYPDLNSENWNTANGKVVVYGYSLFVPFFS